MSNQIENLFHYRIKSGMEEQYQAYLDKVLPVTQAQEPYILAYEISRGSDGSYFQRELYENEEAVWKHMELTAEGQADFIASTEMIELVILGELSKKFRDTYSITTTYTPFRHVTR
jgi:quinol monooxygenase YgiN